MPFSSKSFCGLVPGRKLQTMSSVSIDKTTSSLIDIATGALARVRTNSSILVFTGLLYRRRGASPDRLKSASRLRRAQRTMPTIWRREISSMSRSAPPPGAKGSAGEPPR